MSPPAKPANQPKCSRGRGSTGTPSARPMRKLVHVFLQSECDEAAVRGALNDAAPLLRDGPGGQDTPAPEGDTLDAFMRDALPDTPEFSRRLAARLVEATLTEVGEQFSGEARTPAEIEAYADAMADMFEAYLQRLRGSETSGKAALAAMSPGC